AKQISIVQSEEDLVIEGGQIQDIETNEEFNRIKAFARVSPKHKEDIISRYQAQDKVVAMTGDGVNDALALNMADAGLAMGIQGTDVAKEAADMVISDDSFNSIVKGIEEGRGIFARIRAIVFFFIAINVFEGIVQFILVVFFKMPYFLTGLFHDQWIFLSVTVHMFPGLILTFDTLDRDVMNEKPRDSEDILTKKTVNMMLIYGALMIASMLLVYFLVITETYGLAEGNYEFGAGNEDFLYSDYYDIMFYFTGSEDPDYIEFVEICNALGLNHTDLHSIRIMGKTLTMLMAVLFFCESILVLQIRRPNKSLFRSFKEDTIFGGYLVIGFIFACFLMLMYIPRAGLVFKHLIFNFMFMSLTATDWLVCFLCSLVAIVGFELVKYINRRKGIVY
ncbi:MAG: HAD-IC family P-type ATPase, partial [Candidatus Lokiarchaeota archaeon]|nr:HAD-IC family P-type ATPase [Candidatus Lokiarchaeota archaeon]